MKDQLQGRTLRLEALRTIDTETTYGAEIRTDASSTSADECSEFPNQQGDKSAKRVPNRLLSLLGPRRLAYLEKPPALLSRTQLRLHSYTRESLFILPTCELGSSLCQ
jgi:hypothetical protein